MELISFSILLIFIPSIYGNLFEIKPRADTLTQADEVQNLLKRIIPNHYTLFDIHLNQTDGKLKEVVRIQTYQKDGKVKSTVFYITDFFIEVDDDEVSTVDN